MPGTKRPNRKPGKKRVKRKPAETGTDGGVDPNVKNTRSIAKTYGSQKSSQSLNSPSKTKGSARSR